MEICGELKDYLYQSHLIYPSEAAKWLLQGAPQELNLPSASSQLFPQGTQTHEPTCHLQLLLCQMLGIAGTRGRFTPRAAKCHLLTRL